ncbi:MAG: ABC transporter permease, partial [Deltaproteobacteria bacterium]|nr:ABC transporter permease [Deltaproteobacteria bacterium]
MKEDLKLYLRLLGYVRGYWPRFLVAVVAMLGVSGITALLAYLVKPVLDEVFFAKNLHMLYILPGLVVLLYALKGGLGFLHNYQMSYIGLSTTNRLRNELFQHLQRQPHSFFDGQATGALMSRLNYDVNLLQNAVAKVVTSLFKDIFTVIGLLAVIFYREWRLAILATAVLPFTAYIIVRLGRRIRKLSTATQMSAAELQTIQQENFTGHRIVKAFTREDFEQNRFARLNERFFRLRLKQAIVRSISSPLMDLLGSIAMAAIIFYGGYNVIKGTSTPGTFFSFLAALFMLYSPLKSLSGVHNSIQEGLAAAQRIFGLLDLAPAIQDRP